MAALIVRLSSVMSARVRERTLRSGEGGSTGERAAHIAWQMFAIADDADRPAIEYDAEVFVGRNDLAVEIFTHVQLFMMEDR